MSMKFMKSLRTGLLEVEEGALREGHAAARAAVRQLADLCSHIALAKLEHQPVDAAEREIPTKDHTHPLGLLLDDGELAILEFVPQRHHAADPESLALGSRHLVANALRSDLSLELCERQQHVESEPAHRRRRVELLGH